MTNEQRQRIFEPFGGQTGEKIKTRMSNGVGDEGCSDKEVGSKMTRGGRKGDTAAGRERGREGQNK